jgi:tetratricopeptide (TPR) repeat protein
MPVTMELLEAGLRLHQAGDFPRAEQTYRQLLEREPNSAEGWYLLGALCEARGDLAAATTHLEQALRLRPAFAEALNHRGIVFARQVQLAEAAARFRQALRLKPGHAEIQTNLGLALARQGQCAEAIALLQAVLELQPNYGRAQTYLREAQARQAAAAVPSPAGAARSTESAMICSREGLACLHRGSLDEAAAHFRQALSWQPNSAEAYYNLAYTLAAQKRSEEAIACYQHALRLRADYAEAHINLANVFREQRRFPEAEASCRAAVRLRPGMAEAQNILGATLLEQERLAEALEPLQRAIQLKPDLAGAHNNLGYALWGLARFEEAVISLREALRLQPQFAEAFNNLGNVLRALGRYDEALASYAKALRADPHYIDPQWNMSLVWLLLGDFERGWRQYEWRWQFPNFPYCPPRFFTQPLWDGSPLNGRRILLHAEQGLGDTFQFVRYARLVKERGGTVIVECQRPLRRILAGCPGIDDLVAQGEPLPPHDVRAPFMSLPLLLGTRVDTIPATIPYLTADPTLVEHWRRELAAVPGFKIGIAWKGSPTADKQRSQRSIPLAEFAPLAQVPGVQLVSLQKGPGSEQLAEVAGQWPVIDLSARLDEKTGPFMDTAAVMMNLDLIVTADTAVPHLAGALGMPVWLPLSKVPDWRWFLEREDTPWYPNHRLFRQERRGEWRPVFERIAQAVQQLRSSEPEA